MKHLIALSLLMPLLALAADAPSVSFSWEPVVTRTDGGALDAPALYDASCSLNDGPMESLTPEPTADTSVTWQPDLAGDSGSVACQVVAVDQYGGRSSPSAATATWQSIAPPNAPIVIDIKLYIQCPEGYSCDVQVSP